VSALDRDEHGAITGPYRHKRALAYEDKVVLVMVVAGVLTAGALAWLVRLF